MSIFKCFGFGRSRSESPIRRDDRGRNNSNSNLRSSSGNSRRDSRNTRATPHPKARQNNAARAAAYSQDAADRQASATSATTNSSVTVATSSHLPPVTHQLGEEAPNSNADESLPPARPKTAFVANKPGPSVGAFTNEYAAERGSRKPKSGKAFMHPDERDVLKASKEKEEDHVDVAATFYARKARARTPNTNESSSSSNCTFVQEQHNYSHALPGLID